MNQNVSTGQSVIASCFNWQDRRNKIVTEGLNFPSNDYIYHCLARQGARVVTVPSPDGMTVPLNRCSTPSTKRRAWSASRTSPFAPPTFRTSTPSSAAHIAVGAYVVADLYQSAGILPVDVRALQVDFAVGGSVKWLLGGPGAGYLYVRRDLWPLLEPAATGWQAHRAPFDFAGGPIDYASDAFRFLGGTPNIPGSLCRPRRLSDRQ